MRDTFRGNRSLRILNLLDTYTRECIAIEIDRSLGGNRVVRVLEALKAVRPLPMEIIVDNGPEFRFKALDAWASDNQVKLNFIRPGKPVDNAHIEAFNGRMCVESLNQHWFLNLSDARRILEYWREAYNAARPHRALNRLTT